MKEIFKEPLIFKGVHRVTLIDSRSGKAQELDSKIATLLRRKPWAQEEIHRAIKEIQFRFAEKEFAVENIITLAGRNAVALRLAGVNTYTGNITRGAVGTGRLGAAASQTQLSAEIFRTTVASVDTTNAANGIVIVSFFYSATDFVNSNVNEFGNFIDGIATANSGQMFSRIVFPSAINKTGTKSLTVDCEYTLSST